MLLNSSSLASLRFFEAVARYLSFKRAAVELHVTQGAVSHHIKQLEQALRCPLFYRRARQISLTEDGRRFAEVVRGALELLEREALTMARRHSGVDIRLQAGTSFAVRWLVPRLGSFYARHPDSKLFINADHGENESDRRDYDLSIDAIPSTAAVCAEVLMEESLIPVCTPEYWAEHKFLRAPEDLARCTLLHDGNAWAGADQDAEWRHWLHDVDAPIDSAQGRFFSLSHLALEAALTHQGVAMGRVSLLGELLSKKQLVTPFLQRVKSPIKYCLSYPKEGPTHPGLQAVVSWLHEQAQSSQRGHSVPTLLAPARHSTAAA